MQSRWPRALDASDVTGARRVLFDLIDRNLERLEAKLEVYRGIGGEQAASTAGRLAFDQSPDGERLRRFELACQRRKQRCQDAFWKYRREMERTEGGELRTEGGGLRAEEESGAVNDGSCLEDQNLTTEANGELPASESALDKEIAATSEKISRVEKSLADLRARGFGAAGTGVVGDETHSEPYREGDFWERAADAANFLAHLG